jgi:hypothetical protein
MRPPSRTWRCVLAMLGGSPTVNSTVHTRLTRGCARHGSATSTTSTTSGQAPYIDCIRRSTCTVCFHVGSAIADNKLSVPLSRVSYYLLSLHPNTRGLHHYNITLNTPDTWGCAITSLPQIYSVTWWISFLRLWIYLIRLSGIIFSGSVELFSPA